MISRTLSSIAFSGDWGRQMRFISGPRQCGKTTLARAQLRSTGCAALYYLWDLRSVRQRYKADELFFTADFPMSVSEPWVCLDEIHKMPQWKNILKGLFDSVSDQCRLMVTGSAKLNILRRAGDSLAGRYFTFHLLPVTLAEFTGNPATPAVCPDSAEEYVGQRMDSKPANLEALEQLLQFSGFPEPLLNARAPFHRKWAGDYIDTVIREDIGSLTRIIDREHLHDLYHLLPEMVGSPLSVASLAGHLQVSPVTVKNYLRRLDDFYLTFSLRPYSRNIKRSLLKAPKFYLHDWTRIADAALRFENFVACELLARRRLWADKTGRKFDLFYVRNKQKEETDFLITRDNVPWLLVEVKLSDQPVEKHHLATATALGNIPVIQVCRQPDVARVQRERVFCLSAQRLFA
ncbi:MAG: ATP-binding protein [Lentisphaerae bacterium]|nr:ATP-binding protein [Lentisphaerota bacterium]